MPRVDFTIDLISNIRSKVGCTNMSKRGPVEWEKFNSCGVVELWSCGVDWRGRLNKCKVQVSRWANPAFAVYRAQSRPVGPNLAANVISCK